MVRKRKKREDEQPPWCYYCDRAFSDEQTLVQHQKAKHFKCTVCHKRLTSAGGLRVHCHQVHRFALEKVPFAKPGKESMDVEVFGMAGVPDGAVPGAPPPEEDEPAAQALMIAPLPPAALPPPGSQMPGVLAGGGLVQSHLPYLPPPMHPLSIQQPMPGAQPYAPPAFPGRPPPFMRPPPGMGPPPGFQMPGMPPQAGPGPGPFQQQRPPLFPAGTGPPTHGHPVFPIGQAPGLAAISNPSSEPVSQPQPVFPVGQGVASGAALAQSHVPIAAADAQPAMQPRLRAVFPIGQGAASGGHLALGAVPITDLSARPALQPQPVFSAVQPAASSAPLAPGLAGGLHLSAEPLGQPQLAGLAASLVHATPHPQQKMPSPAAGYGTPNGSMHTTPAQYDAPVLDESNPAVIWKAIDMSMEESRAQQPKYQQKLNRAAGYM